MELKDFLNDVKGKVFRMWEYKKMFTPYEQENKFVDETQFVSDESQHVIIENAYMLNGGDVLLRMSLLDVDGYHIWRRLSEIQLEEYEHDTEELKGE